MFYVGQKVVCIRKKPWGLSDYGGLPPFGGPRFGEVYTVVGKSTGFISGSLTLKLKEFPNTQEDEFFWLAAEFRPLCSRPTSIEIFKRAPTPARETEKV